VNPSIAAVAAAMALAAPAAAFAASQATSFSDRSDPARWYEPLETAQQKHDNALLEARNALAEALRECRRTSAERKSCEAAARSQYQREVSNAKTLLAPTRQLG
jgi:hypothetical protein